MLPYLNVFASTELLVPVIVLLVKLSTVVLQTKVSLVKPPGIVKVAPFTIDDIEGATRVLFERVCIDDRLIRVDAPDGITTLPPFEIVDIIGSVNVLFVNVSTVFLQTKVSFVLGTLIPVKNPFCIKEIEGLVKVLLVNVCVPLRVTKLLTGIVPAPKVLTTVALNGPEASPDIEFAAAVQLASPAASEVNMSPALAPVGIVKLTVLTVPSTSTSL